MKKKREIKLQPLFKKDKELLSIINSPNKFKMLRDVVDQAQKVNERIKNFDNIFDWFAYCETLLPEKFDKKEEFEKKLEALVYEYCDELEGSDSVDPS